MPLVAFSFNFSFFYWLKYIKNIICYCTAYLYYCNTVAVLCYCTTALSELLCYCFSLLLHCYLYVSLYYCVSCLSSTLAYYLLLYYWLSPTVLHCYTLFLLLYYLFTSLAIALWYITSDSWNVVYAIQIHVIYTNSKCHMKRTCYAFLKVPRQSYKADLFIRRKFVKRAWWGLEVI